MTAHVAAFFTCNECEQTSEAPDGHCPSCGSDDLTRLEEIPLTRDTPYTFAHAPRR